MDGNARPALTSANPDSSFARNFQNGQRGYVVPTLSRSSSVREGLVKANSRDAATSPANLPSLSQCLMLEPVVMGDPKYARSGEFKRALGFSVGSNLEENSFRAAHLKKSPPAGVEEIKRLRSSVIDTCVKASGRAKKLDQHLNKLNKFCEAMPSKKQLQQRNEVLTNEQLSNGPPLKIGSQMHRNLSDTGSQRLDDRPKSVVLNKRIRTSVAEARVESRNNGFLRHPIAVTKESDMLKYNDEDSDIVEEKIRRLPTGGEGWDKKMKRKRSVGAGFSRSVGSDGELKRHMHHKLTMESTLQTIDSTQGFRSGASSDSSKLDPMPSPGGSTARLTLKNEQEKSVVSSDLSGKVNVKLSNREDNRATGSNTVVKGKASRAPRSVSITADNSAAVNVPRLSGTLEIWEPAPVDKTLPVGGANNRKRSMTTGLCSPSITQWGGQRPQKISRTRRTNIAPVSNQDEIHFQSEGCLPSDFGSGLNIVGINASLSNGTANENQNFKVKPENVPSPVRLSESEEYCSGEIRINDNKGVVHRDFEEKTMNAGEIIGAPATLFKRNKIMVKEESGDGVRRQGHSGRVSPFSRPSISPTREKLETVVPTKPFQNERSDSDKGGRKSGRPMKKQSDRRGSRVGNAANRDSPDCCGESDDLEELLTAANLACSSSFKACSSPFWKTFDVLFASVGQDEKSYLSEQLKLAEESCASVIENYNNGNAAQLKLDGYQDKRRRTSDSISCRRSESMMNKNYLTESLERMGSPEHLQFSSLYEFSTSVTPLSQRLLSAMIIEEDKAEESEGTGYVNPRASFGDTFLISSEYKLMGRLGSGEPEFGVQTWKNVNAHNYFPCKGSTEINGSPSAQDRACYGELLPRDVGYMHSEVELLVGVSRCGNVPKSLQANNIGFSSSDFQYGQMCLEEKLVLELESVGLFLEAVPALNNKEDELINQELALLERRLHEQAGKKKTCLHKIYKAAQGENIARHPEQVAMDKLVEIAYKKLLATRGSFATKHGIPKVSRQVAMAFSKRTLARCQKFEDSGASCFSESAFREIVYAAPTPFAESELLSRVNLTFNGSSVDAFETPTHQPVTAVGKIVPMSNRGRKKEVLLDDFVGFRSPSPLGILSGGAKGKRSERDRDRDVNIKGDRKTKAKVKQKASQLSMSANALFTDTRNTINPSILDNVGGGSMKKTARFMSFGNVPLVSPKETNESKDLAKLPINEVDVIEELDVESEIGAPQDINAWLSFEVDGLQDHDGIGLEIPNDDLSDLNMF